MLTDRIMRWTWSIGTQRTPLKEFDIILLINVPTHIASRDTLIVVLHDGQDALYLFLVRLLPHLRQERCQRPVQLLTRYRFGLELTQHHIIELHSSR